MCPLCVSLFFAQAIGLWLAILAIAMLIHQDIFKKTIQTALSNETMVLIAGLVHLPIGLVIVVVHNVWVNGWPVLITIFGWLFLLKGLMQIFFPETFAAVMKNLIAKKGYAVMTCFWFLVGIYLTWIGFFA